MALTGLNLITDSENSIGKSTNTMKVNGELAARALNEKAQQYYLADPEFQIFEYEYTRFDKLDEQGEPTKELRYAFGREIEGKFEKEGLTFEEMNSLLAEYEDIDLQDRAEQNMLDEKDFREYVKDHIREYLPAEYKNADVQINDVTKNNDTLQHCILIRNEDQHIAPRIYLENFFDRYENGAAINSILTDISNVYINNLAPDFKFSPITDYENIKDKISIKLLNVENNKDYLKGKPYSTVNDLAMVYKIDISKEASAIITNDMLKVWDKSADDIKTVALDNMAKQPYSLESMAEIVAKKMELPLDLIEAQMPVELYVLSNESNTNGASMILNDKAMREISDRFNDDLIIIPSSIHEVIIMPSKEAPNNLDGLNEIINGANASVLAPDEVLSDKAYGYDKKTHEIIIADQLSVFKSVEQTLEQNDNMLDGIINNGANAREIPGTYDEAEREADELARAKKIITDYSLDEFDNEPDFSDLSHVSLAYTTIDYPEFLKEAGVENYEKDFELQVEANLEDNELVYYADGDEIFTEKYDSLKELNDSIEGVRFDDIISLNDEGWQKIAERELDREAQAALDTHEAEFGADGSRVFPHLNDEPEDKIDVFLYPEHTNDDTKAISDFLSDKGIDYRFVSVNNADVVRVNREELNTLTEILANRDINFAIEPEEALAIQIDALMRDFDPYSYDDNTDSRNEAVQTNYSLIMTGTIEPIMDILKDVRESDDVSSANIANTLIGKLQDIEDAQLDLEMDALDEPVFLLHKVLQNDSDRQYFDYDAEKDQFIHRSISLDSEFNNASLDIISPEEAMMRIDDYLERGYKELDPANLEKLHKEKAENLIVGDVITLNDKFSQFDFDKGTHIEISTDALEITNSELKSNGEEEYIDFTLNSLKNGETFTLTSKELDDVGYKYDDHIPTFDEPEQEQSSVWEQINHKMVYDSDGMMTDYTMYHNTVTDEYAAVFGDKDIYRPEDRDFDWEGDSLEEANEWFESYDPETLIKDDKDLVGDKNMNYEEFKSYVQEHIKEHLPEEYANATVKLQEVVKNNDNILSGVCIQKEDSNIAPNIYLESFFERYENGAELAQILDNIADIRVKNEPEQSFDVSNLTDIFKVRDKIIPVLISEEMNKEYLADKPYTTVSDMAVVYKINLGGDSDGRMSAPVTNQLLDSYGISKEELKDIAFANLSEQEMDFMTMREMLAKMMGIDLQDLNDPRIAMLPPDAGIPMYVLSNQEKIYGASAMLSDKVMDNIAEKLGGDFVVIPSSIHEVIILPINPEFDKATLEGMISDVNNSQVAPEERLSYNLYGYNAEEHKLVLASELPFFREENIVKDNPVVDVPTNEENKSQSEKNLADKVKDAILEAGGVSEKKEPIKLNVSEKLVGEPYKTKDGRTIVRVKIPNSDRNDKSPWDSFVVSTHDIEKTGDGKANISLTPDGTHKIYSPKIIGTDENGKTMFENTEIRVSNADIKSRFDALSVDHNKTVEDKVNLKDMIKTNKESNNKEVSKELKLRGTEFIVQLPKEMQDKIKDAISKVEGADVKTAMDGRLTDLEDNIDWRKVLDIKPDNPFTKDHSAR